jgi:hypothetical protein
VKCDLKVFDEQSFLQYLDLGWHYSPAACYEAVQVEMSDEEIRTDAKAKGIKNWYNKKIDKLKVEIDAWQPGT